MLSFPRNDIVVKIKFTLVKSTRERRKKNEETSMGYILFLRWLNSFNMPKQIDYVILLLFLLISKDIIKRTSTRRGKVEVVKDFLHDIFMVHSVKTLWFDFVMD